MVDSFSPIEDHLDFHDICSFEMVVDKFHKDLMNEMEGDSISEPKSVYDKVRSKFCQDMSTEEEMEYVYGFQILFSLFELQEKN